MNVFIRSIYFGIANVFVGLMVSFIITLTVHSKSEQEWNKYHIMEIALFITGFFVNIFTEMFGYKLSKKSKHINSDIYHPASY
jgi:uncharacterized membrane protein YphA (DoxX/SURF4 family)